MRTLLLLISLLAPILASSFAVIRNKAPSRRAFSSSATRETDTVTSEPAAVTRDSGLPSWEDLELSLSKTTAVNEEKPVVTLYRDTNGWCPFCERVWLALRVKNLPYRERLISLQNKPDWYKELVPTTLVPAVLLHNQEGEEDGEKKERRIVWESIDILEALDEAFPDTPKLMLDTPEFREAMKMNDELQSAGFGFSFAMRNSTLTAQDVKDRKKQFEEKLDLLDETLAANSGPFRLGKEFSGVDACMIPSLERWRYQLPIMNDMDILEGRPALQKWFDAMDAYGPYAHRVAGDRYSWTATSSMFLRYFGGGEDNPKAAAAIERSDKAAANLVMSFGDYRVEEDGSNQVESSSTFSTEAAAKLISNHEAVVKDCTRKEPISQQHVPRASKEAVADAVLRNVAWILLRFPEKAMDRAHEAPLADLSSDDFADGALAARTVASRLCVPRDMSAPAAAVLRGVLSIVAGRLEKEAN